jgi:WD40 repeat protein
MIHIKKISELTGHAGAVYALEQSETADCFYSGSSDKIVARWNLKALCSETFSAQMPGIVYSLCLLPAKNILLAGTSEGKIHVMDLAEKKEIKILQNHNQPIFDIKYSSLHESILSAGGDGVLSVISADDFSTIKLIKLCKEKIRAIAIFENFAAVACGDGIIRIIDLKELKVKNEFPAHTGSVYSVTFSPDGKLLLSGGKDAYLKSWLFQPETSDLQPATSIPAHNYSIYSIVFSPDNKYFATASRDKTIKIWDTGSFDILIRINKEDFEGHNFSVNKLFWSKFNDRLISTGDDKKVMVWEINS